MNNEKEKIVTKAIMIFKSRCTQFFEVFNIKALSEKISLHQVSMNETRCLMDRLALFQKQKIEKNHLESKLMDEMNFACLSERINF